jgi:hypothetical protein
MITPRPAISLLLSPGLMHSCPCAIFYSVDTSTDEKPQEHDGRTAISKVPTAG